MSSLPDLDALDAALLTLVLARHPAPVHEDDLARALGPDDWPANAADLAADGLLHREGRLYLASRAAVRCHELLG